MGRPQTIQEDFVEPPKRKSPRHPTYDYRTAGAYFVTFVTHDRLCLFDDPVLKRVAETY